MQFPAWPRIKINDFSFPFVERKGEEKMREGGKQHVHVQYCTKIEQENNGNGTIFNA